LKELAILSDKHEEQQKLVIDQQKTLNDAKFKINSLQAKLESQVAQEQHLQDEITEINKANEIQTRKWDEKHAQMFNRIQEVEARNAELRALEEKYTQMQLLLTNLGSIAGTPIVHENILQKHSTPAPKEPKFSAFVTEQISTSIAPKQSEEITLFDSPKITPRYKQNLFE
jgi:small-conductance mechanosensitive channel